MLLTQENLELMTISFQKSQNKVEALEELKQENERIIQHLYELKSYLAKNCAEKDMEIKNLKALFERDRRAFQSVREYQLERLGRLKHKYHNALMYLWEMSRKCDCDCKEAWVNPGNTFKPIHYPEDVPLSLDFNSFLKGCNGLTTEPNLTILNTTVTSYEHELYRYRKMNEMLEDQIKEYESDYTTSSSSLKVSEESSEDISSLQSSLQDDLSSLHICASSSQELESLEISDLYDLNDNNTIKKVKFLE
ncbi:uncharacterized protein LOC126829626 [Patella vulgata]|uniref:uncharacterized protein LOC126829626 n=1 Tax=Patella vulgata TaxID=6465 RepID=UPI0024A7A67E|nr:uncharacterized protein LOC126829626 [Patella vulgata]